MQNLIKVVCENTSTSLFVRQGTTLSQFMEMITPNNDHRYIAAWVDNRLRDLSWQIFSEKSVRLTEITSSEGMKTYARTLFFILEKSILDVLPGSRVRMMHPVGRGMYCEIDGRDQISADLIAQIKARMLALIAADLPIVRTKIEYSQAMEMYEKTKATDKIALLKTRPYFFVTMYNLAGTLGYFFGEMAPSTGYIKTFDIQQFGEGLVVLMPKREDLNEVETIWVQPKLFDVFHQNKHWVNILGVPNVGDLNQKLVKGEGGDLIKIGEALQEKNFAATADLIAARGVTKLVLIAGPSSSGKTSFSKRLSIQLNVLGYVTHTISLDNYFVEREATPKDENGEYDFDCLEALDIESFNSDLLRLFAGENIELCKFNFHTGKRTSDGECMQLTDRSILIVEGIHALNPKLTSHLDSNIIFKIYASALTTLALDDMNVIHTTDNRLLRRMVRDYKYRSRSAYQTIQGWQSVRRGEDKHIFPFQENADVMFGTSLFFEIPILKKYAMPILMEVPHNVPEYSEALRLMFFLSYFVDMPDHELPPTSILREFIGGSSFSY